MSDVDRELPYEEPSVEMVSEDEPRGWLDKTLYTRSQAKQWAVAELGIDWTEVRVRTTWIRGLTDEERKHDDWMGGYGCERDHPAAVAYWEVRDATA